MITRFILVCLCLFILPVQAMACSCTEESFTDIASRKNIAKANYIFEGGAVKVKDGVVAQFFSEVTFRIDHLHKGAEKKESIKALVDTKSSCGMSFDQLRKTRLFILYAHTDKYILAGQCGSYISDADKAALKLGVYLSKE